jgi:hypothetical protein
MGLIKIIFKVTFKKNLYLELCSHLSKLLGVCVYQK